MRHGRLVFIGFLVGIAPMAALASGCSEAVSPGSGGSTSTSTTSQSTTTSTHTTSTGATTSASTGSGMGGVRINEMSGAGDDYIELVNVGDKAVDLSGIRLADQDSPGTPKLDSALEFPDGTTLTPGAYLFVLGGKSKADATPQTDCAPGPSPCFYVTFKLSNSNGDGAFLVEKSGTVLESEAYPGNLADGETWSRLPDGTGDFAKGKATPGAANEAP